jgi:hypothetical protein
MRVDLGDVVAADPVDPAVGLHTYKVFSHF